VKYSTSPKGKKSIQMNGVNVRDFGKNSKIDRLVHLYIKILVELSKINLKLNLRS